MRKLDRIVRLRPSHIALGTRLRPTCSYDRKMLDSWVNHEEFARLAKEVVNYRIHGEIRCSGVDGQVCDTDDCTAHFEV